MYDRFLRILPGERLLLFMLLSLIFVVVYGGCAAILKEKPPEEIITLALPWDVENYADFLKQNMKNMNERYSTEYAPYNFVVDTDMGSTPIQNLIEPEIAFEIKNRPWSDNMEDDHKRYKIFQYVQNDYNFIMEPNKWSTVKETVKSKKGIALTLVTAACQHCRGNVHDVPDVNHGQLAILHIPVDHAIGRNGLGRHHGVLHKEGGFQQRPGQP